MPSPFPGMDPYLEDPTLWPDVHHELISISRELLLAALRPKYFVQIDERLYVATEFDEARSVIVPDLRIRESRPSGQFAATSASAVAVIEPGIEIETEPDVEIRESFLQVVDREQDRVVTILEILSPANKVKGSAGRISYKAKRHSILASGINFVEIDLLRMKPPLYTRADFPPFDYISLVSQWTGYGYRRWAWPMKLREKLKPIPVPVKRGDPHAVLDLQRMVDTAYERAGYELRVDYQKQTVPPLTGDNAEWAKQIVDQPANAR